MSAKDFPVPIGQSLPEAISDALGRLPADGPCPILLVESPVAAQSLKQALAKAQWPAKASGAPLPICFSLEESLEQLIDWAGLHCPEEGAPRSLLARSADLAQTLLDFGPIARSLGGSAQAALDLGLRWTALFDGWEWLGEPSLCPDAPHLSRDMEILRTLQAENQKQSDRAAWARRLSARRRSEVMQPVWFCFGRKPSAKELAMASAIIGVPKELISIWRLCGADQDLLAPERLGSWCAELTAPRHLISAQTIEESAWASVQTILGWRAQGIDEIGVMALDRKALRRVRALLERAGEPLSDPGGWALDTSVAASAVFGLVDLLGNRATTQGLLEWVHSPFVLRGLKLVQAWDETWLKRVDQALRAYGRVAEISLESLQRHGLLPAPLAGLGRKEPKGRSCPLSELLAQLMQAVQACGLDQALAEDTAGQAVLSELEKLRAEADHDDVALNFSLLHAVLARQISNARFSESEPRACVHVCSLQSLAWRHPKALLMVGADAQRFPDRPEPYFFEPERIAQMGLASSPEEQASEFVAQMIELWRAPMPVTMIACSEKPDSQAEFAHVIEMLAIAGPGCVRRQKADDFVGRYALQTGLPQQQPLPRWLNPLPAEVSVTDAQMLMQCPYQFYLARLIGLQPMESLHDEGLASDTGSLVHLILAAARLEITEPSGWSTWLTQEIERRLSRGLRIGVRTGAPDIPIPRAVAAKLKADLMSLVPGLAIWLAQQARSAPTERQVLTEQDVRRAIESLGTCIKGRIDRWETSQGGAVLIDFKTSSAAELRRRLKSEDGDVQLGLYAWMVGHLHPVSDARYVSVRREGVEELRAATDPDRSTAEQAEQVAQAVIKELTALSSGSAIQMSGLTKDRMVCERCRLRGVCRRDEWIDDHGLE